MIDELIDESNTIIGIAEASVKGGARAILQGAVPIIVFGATVAVAVGLVNLGGKWIGRGLNG